MIVGAVEIAAIADADRGHEETGATRLRLCGLSRGTRQPCGSHGETSARDELMEAEHRFLPNVLINRRFDEPAWPDINPPGETLFRPRDAEMKTPIRKRRRGTSRSALHHHPIADGQVC
jgi:hypothetical protein